MTYMSNDNHKIYFLVIVRLKKVKKSNEKKVSPQTLSIPYNLCVAFIYSGVEHI